MLCIVALFSSSVIAQTASPAQTQPASAQASVQTPPARPANSITPRFDYSKSRAWWTPMPYMGRDVAAPNFENTPRIENIMREGTIYLSLSDAIALALENNLDIAIARYNLNIADTDILRASSGGSTRGVNTGIVSGTPGGSGTGVTGSSGGGAGGTTAGAGGAGTGASGIVLSTSGVGAPIDSFDPVLTGNLGVNRTKSPQANTVFSGVPTLVNNTGSVNFGYSQGWVTGTAMTLDFNNTRQTTNATRTTLNPQLSSDFRLTLRQHLLSGFGLENNRRFIIQASNNKRISDISFRQQIIQTVSQIQNIYWDLVNAYEDMKVRERSLEFANRTLADNRKQVEIGTLAPIEIVRAQSQVAASTQDLIVSQTNLQYQQLLMKNAITRNLADNRLAAAPVIPTDTLNVAEMQVRPVQDLIAEALQNRPELQQSDIDLKNRDLNRRTARNALLPSLDLIGFYGASSIAGPTNPSAICDPANPQFGCIEPSQVPSATGYSTAFRNLFNSSAPDKGVALQLNIPIRNRAAQADQVRSELEFRQAEMRRQQLINQIGIEVRNAAYAVQQNRARIEASRAARDFAVQSLEAEQKKYALGASTSYLVLQAQRDLAEAESNLVASMSAYEKARVELERVTAITLDRNGIVLQDAVTGEVQQTPRVPDAVPAPEQSITRTQQIQRQMQQTPEEQMQQLQKQMQQPAPPQQQQ